MPAPTIFPGRAFQGTQKTSDLAFNWRAADLSLTALTGQVGVFTRASAGGLVQGTGSRQWLDPANQLRLVGPAPDQLERWEWVQNAAGTYVPALRLEGTRENLALQSETLGTTWNATNITVANNQTVAPDGKSTAESLTASAGNGTLIQDLGVIGSAATNFSIWLKRKTGTGNIDLTLDNGSGWTTVAVTSEWARFNIQQTLANPDVGIRIVTNADAIYAWGGQAEAGPLLSTYMPTVGSTVTRAAEGMFWPFALKPSVMTVYCKFREQGTNAAAARVLQITNAGNSAPRIAITSKDANYSINIVTVGDNKSSVPSNNVSLGDVVEFRAVLAASGAVTGGCSLNGGGEVIAAQSAAPSDGMPAAWSGTRLYLNSAGTAGAFGFGSFLDVKVARGVRSMQFMREVL